MGSNHPQGSGRRASQSPHHVSKIVPLQFSVSLVYTLSLRFNARHPRRLTSAAPAAAFGLLGASQRKWGSGSGPVSRVGGRLRRGPGPWPFGGSLWHRGAVALCVRRSGSGVSRTPGGRLAWPRVRSVMAALVSPEPSGWCLPLWLWGRFLLDLRVTLGLDGFRQFNCKLESSSFYPLTRARAGMICSPKARTSASGGAKVRQGIR